MYRSEATTEHAEMPTAAADCWDVIIVGAGAAGLVAAGTAAARGKRTLLLEKNRKPGVKILMSGGSRCNITQNTNNRGIVEAYGPPGRFLHSALASLGVQETIAMFESEGVATKVEETGKIFPASDKALDVLSALLRRAERSGAVLALDEALMEIEGTSDGFLLRSGKRNLRTTNLLITTGGQSYPGCGTTGDGYRFAAQFGHTIVPPRPALVPITTDAPWVRNLRGITIPDVGVKVIEPPNGVVDPEKSKPAKPRVLADRRGSFLFAHFGLSGPSILDVSRAVSGHPQPRSLSLLCDFLPNVKPAALDEQLRSRAAAEGKKQLVNLMPEELPHRLCESLLAAVGLDPAMRAGEVGTKARAQAVTAIKAQAIPVSGTCGFGKAEVTAGGVSLAEVDSKTLQSKLASRLFLAGEVLDLDGPIGGYNFQAAWSTGHLAALSME
jgi:predicted Rossmann fold flavoprotein